MATVEVAYLSPIGDNLDNSNPSSVQIITSSASNQVGTGAAGASDVAVITAAGGDVYVSFGPSPNATSDALRRLVVDGTTRAFGVVAGHSAAIVDV